MERYDSDRTTETIILANLGKAVQRDGDYERAATLLTQALTLSEKSGHKQGITLCVLGLAGIAAMQGTPERAARLLGAAEHFLDTVGAKLWPADRLDYEHSLAVTRAQLDDATFDRARREGRAWSLDRTIEYALERSNET